MDKRLEPLSKEELERVVPKDVKSDFKVNPTVKREVLDQYRREKGIKPED
jgi:hypothetical protein